MPWHAKPTYGYLKESVEAQENGLEFLGILLSLGWTKESASAAWGNIEHESAYNPWRWQYEQILSSTDPSIDTSREHGYGLVQFTPAGKYIHNQTAMSTSGYGPNFSNRTGQVSDGYVQTIIMDMIADQQPNPQWQDATTWGYPYSLTWNEFKTNSSGWTPEYLAKAWLHQYERPLDQSASVENIRAQTARYWYDLWGGVVPPTPPTPTGSSKFKWWLYTRRRF